MQILIYLWNVAVAIFGYFSASKQQRLGFTRAGQLSKSKILKESYSCSKKTNMSTNVFSVMVWNVEGSMGKNVK